MISRTGQHKVTYSWSLCHWNAGEITKSNTANTKFLVVLLPWLYSVSVAGCNLLVDEKLSLRIPPKNIVRGRTYTARKWEVHRSAQTENIVLEDEDKKSWDACRQVLSTFQFSEEDTDKILGKSFGHIHSPYWYEERKKEVPRLEVVNAILDYLRSLSLSNNDITKILKKFPEVLGCCLEDELRKNVDILDKQWGISGKTLKNLLLRNPKVLGYNVDCRGDCEAKCTRCWVRF